MASRNQSIDLLRAFGLLLVIMAHTRPPDNIFQLRNFDVPLMVLVSGMSYALSRGARGYAEYVWSRIKRLVFPVWIFLTVFFLSLFITRIGDQIVTPQVIAESYLLSGGIGYLWIIRIFIIVACLAPAISVISRKLEKELLLLTALALSVALYALLMFATKAQLGWGLESPFVELVFSTLGYGMIFLLGLRYADLSGRSKIVIAVFGAVLLVASLFDRAGGGLVFDLQRFKYPPQIPYIAYALMIFAPVYYAAVTLSRRWGDAPVFAVLEFMARNSIWIYLWHIPVVLADRQFGIFPNFGIMYAATLLIAVSVAWVQVSLVDFVVDLPIVGPRLRRFLLQILTG